VSIDQAKSDQVSMEALASGAEKTFENAEQLFFEAELLAKAGAVTRALYLHQISLEECSKVDTLGAWAVSLLTGLEVDQKKVLAALARHSSKNKSNAYMLEGSAAEKDAKSRGDLKGAIEAFKTSQEEFHQASNKAKNAALYVDRVDGAFAAPSERITDQMLVEITERNAKFLGYAHKGVKMMKRLASSPDKMKGLLSGFVEQAEKLRDEDAENPVAAMEALLARFLEDGKRELEDENFVLR
jgi:AbiV family abortive infection protein